MNKSRPCIFCGGAGLSKEHLFSAWLKELFPRTPKDTRTFGKTKQWPGFSLESKQGHAGTKKVREVCQPCNEGWISRLDKAAKPIAAEMIQAHPITLAPDMQKILATWLTKMSMVGDNIDRQGSRISQEHRGYLCINLEPPPTWQIWISSYSGSRWHHLRMEQLRSPLELPDRPKTYFASNVIGMGAMLVLVLGHGAEDLKLEIGHPADRLLRIWPTSETFDWPTDHDLSDEEADDLTKIWTTVRLIPA